MCTPFMIGSGVRQLLKILAECWAAGQLAEWLEDWHQTSQGAGTKSFSRGRQMPSTSSGASQPELLWYSLAE